MVRQFQISNFDEREDEITCVIESVKYVSKGEMMMICDDEVGGTARVDQAVKCQAVQNIAYRQIITELENASHLIFLRSHKGVVSLLNI
jgi:hypothetical protein